MLFDSKEYTKQELKVISWIYQLSKSQGFYSRLYEEIQVNRDLVKELANMDFKDPLDLVLYLEC